jgi:hypothetical protein
VPLGRNRAQPSRTVRAGPAATRGAARAHGAGAARVRVPARPARSTRGAWQRCTAAALLDEPTAARCRRAGDGRGTGAHRRGDGSVARCRRASGFGQDSGAVGEAVGVTARSVRRSTSLESGLHSHFWTLGTIVCPAPNFMQICTLVDHDIRNSFSCGSGD